MYDVEIYVMCKFMQILFLESAARLDEVAVKYGFNKDSIISLTSR